jgi:hypothetical protein
MGCSPAPCASHGLLVDISNPEKPCASTPPRHELLAVAHRGVQQRRLQDRLHRRVGRRHLAQLPETHPLEMGGNTTLSIGPDKKLKQHAYFKIPSSQSAQENCVSHNGSLIPIPGAT